MTRVNSFLYAAMFAACTAAAAHAGECRFDRTLTVPANGFLDANTGSGNLKIVPGSDTQVHISGHAKSSNWMGGSSEEVQRICNEPPIEQNGSSIKIGHEHSDWFRHVSVDYDIEVPAGFSVHANSGSGDVELHDLKGEVTGNTGSGDVRASNLGSGAKLETGSGNIQANELHGTVKLETGSGDIRAKVDNGGDVHANTGSGNIQIEGVGGGLYAQTGSGDVTVSGKPASAWRVGTGSGNVVLRMGDSAGFELDAESSSGDISTRQTIEMQGSLSKHHVHGRVGSGGPEVRAETGSGNITIE